jgi:CTP:molybdopterin cytidylyltransferase MocA
VSKIAGAVLAAGSGTRMGGPKAELVVNGVRLLDRAVTALVDGGCDEVIAIVREGSHASGARLIVNARPEDGLRSSLALAVDAVPADCDALVIVLVDMPNVRAETIDAVRTHWLPGRITLADYAGRSGHPTAMSVDMWRAAVAIAQPDEGARSFIAASAEQVDLVRVTGAPVDLDTPSDLEYFIRGRGNQTQDLSATNTAQPDVDP